MRYVYIFHEKEPQSIVPEFSDVRRRQWCSHFFFSNIIISYYNMRKYITVSPILISQKTVYYFGLFYNGYIV